MRLWTALRHLVRIRRLPTHCFHLLRQVAMTRTHLAVAWGRGLMDDETFRGLDDKYAKLSDALQSSR